MPTPINIKNFSKCLQGYDKELVDYLVDGLTHGFKLEIDEGASFHARDESPPRYNHKSISRNELAIEKKIQKELDAGRVEGPFDEIPYENYQVSALAAAEKKTPGEYRLIQDLSWPRGSSVNDSIDVEKGKCTYQTLDEVIDTLVKLGPGTMMSIFDIEHAYKVLPVWPQDVPKMGFYFKGKFYFDKTLAMGLRTSAKIFEKFSTAVEWILKVKFKLANLHHILDDFIMLTLPVGLTEMQIQIFKDACKYLGVPLKVSKLQSGVIVIYLGMELDSERMEVRLPLEKVNKCKKKINSILGKQSVRRLELESCAGLLNFACRAIRPGRAFLRRVYDTIKTAKSKFHHIKVKDTLKLDLSMWLQFLESFNGTVLFPEGQWTTDKVLNCYTDSSPKGFGIVFGEKWAYGPFPRDWSHFNICFLELYPIVLMLEMFGEQLQQKKLLMFTDNMALVYILNSQTSKDPQIMKLVRRFVLLALKHNVLCKWKHVSTHDNILADPLSRMQVERFRRNAEELGLQMEAQETKIPESLWPSNYKLE